MKNIYGVNRPMLNDFYYVFLKISGSDLSHLQRSILSGAFDLGFRSLALAAP